MDFIVECGTFLVGGFLFSPVSRQLITDRLSSAGCKGILLPVSLFIGFYFLQKNTFVNTNVRIKMLGTTTTRHYRRRKSHETLRLRRVENRQK